MNRRRLIGLLTVAPWCGSAFARSGRRQYHVENLRRLTAELRTNRLAAAEAFVAGYAGGLKLRSTIEQAEQALRDYRDSLAAAGMVAR